MFVVGLVVGVLLGPAWRAIRMMTAERRDSHLPLTSRERRQMLVREELHKQ